MTGVSRPVEGWCKLQRLVRNAKSMEVLEGLARHGQ